MMKLIGGLGVIFVLGVTGLAEAQEEVPRARTGFQMALRTGFAIPFGKVSADDPQQKLSDFASGQVPLFVELGGKVIPNLFLGGYLGFAFGKAGGTTADACDATNNTCVSVGFRLGIEAQYHILPHEFVNPWFGYGLGFESLALGVSSGGEKESLGYGGFEFAHFMAGADFRLSRPFGVGPFVDFAMGSYSRYSIDEDRLGKRDGSIEKTATHEWLTLGVRFVFFP
jgi:hypothetical protein